MSGPDDCTLAERVARLERDNRRMRRVGLAALVVMCGGIAMGQVPKGKVIEAEGFQVVDKDGKVRATLKMEPYGPALSLLDKAGAPRVMMSPGYKTSAGMALFDEDGKQRMVLDVGSDGSPSLRLYDVKQEERAILGVTGTQTVNTGETHMRPESSLVLLDKDGKVIFEAP